MIPEDENYLLEFVLGHEIAHVELQHALGCLRNPSVRTFSDGTLQKLYLLIIPHGYFDEQEYAADEWVYHRMKRLKRSEHDCLKFLRMLDKYADAQRFREWARQAGGAAETKGRRTGRQSSNLTHRQPPALAPGGL